MEDNKYTIEELQKFRVDCMYGKKKHYNARDRYAKYHKYMGVVIVSLTAFMGTSVYYSLSGSELFWARVVTGILVVIIAVLAALQTYLNFEKKALSYKVTADRYLWLMKESQLILSYHRDGSKTIGEIQKAIEKLYQEAKDIQKNEPETSPKDYEKAKKGIKDGEETYTDEEKV